MSTTNLFGVPRHNSGFERQNDWTSAFTPLFTLASGFGAAALHTVCKRDGDSLKVRAVFQSGTVAGTSAYIQLPPGLHIDFTKIVSPTATCYIGLAIIISAENPVSVGSRLFAVVDPAATNLTNTQIGFAFQTSAGGFNLPTTCSNLMNSGNSMHMEFEVPIIEFAL